MYCSKCGIEVANDARFCPGCGAPVGQQAGTASNQGQNARPTDTGNSLSGENSGTFDRIVSEIGADQSSTPIIALILGITAVILALIFGPVGLVLGIIGRKVSLDARTKIGANTFVSVGLALSIIGLILGIVFTIIWVVSIVMVGSLWSIGF